MKNFLIKDASLEGLRLLRRNPKNDERGQFTRLFCAEELELAGWKDPISQINFSFTKMLGTIRGMHYQMPPYAEMKIISCIKGAVWDVAMDLRAGSSTFMKWQGFELSEDNGVALLIPPGFAHGFQTLSNNVELIYCHSKPYSCEAERGINPADPVIGINWPIKTSMLSARDKGMAMIANTFKGIDINEL